MTNATMCTMLEIHRSVCQTKNSTRIYMKDNPAKFLRNDEGLTSPHNFPCFPGSSWMVFGIRRANVLGFPRYSTYYDPDDNPPMLQPDGQTDRQTTCSRKTALCTSASRGKKHDRLRNAARDWEVQVHV